MLPIGVQYFNMVYGAVNFIICFFENAGESADGMLRCMRKNRDNVQLDLERVPCFLADSANCDFGANINTNIPTLNYSVIKVNCNAHILHRSVKSALQGLNVDKENTILKIYGHYSLSAKRFETLNDIH